MTSRFFAGRKCSESLRRAPYERRINAGRGSRHIISEYRPDCGAGPTQGGRRKFRLRRCGHSKVILPDLLKRVAHARPANVSMIAVSTKLGRPSYAKVILIDLYSNATRMRRRSSFAPKFSASRPHRRRRRPAIRTFSRLFRVGSESLVPTSVGSAELTSGEGRGALFRTAPPISEWQRTCRPANRLSMDKKLSPTH